MTIDLRTMLAFSCYWCPLQHNDIIKAISVTCDCFYHPIISDETAGTLCVDISFDWIDMPEIIVVWGLSIYTLPDLFVVFILYLFNVFFLFFCSVLLFFSHFCCHKFFFIRIYYNLMYLKVMKVHLAYFSTYKRITETQKILKLLNLGWISARGFLDWDWVTFSH